MSETETKEKELEIRDDLSEQIDENAEQTDVLDETNPESEDQINSDEDLATTIEDERETSVEETPEPTQEAPKDEPILGPEIQKIPIEEMIAPYLNIQLLGLKPNVITKIRKTVVESFGVEEKNVPNLSPEALKRSYLDQVLQFKMPLTAISVDTVSFSEKLKNSVRIWTRTGGFQLLCFLLLPLIAIINVNTYALTRATFFIQHFKRWAVTTTKISATKKLAEGALKTQLSQKLKNRRNRFFKEMMANFLCCLGLPLIEISLVLTLAVKLTVLPQLQSYVVLFVCLIIIGVCSFVIGVFLRRQLLMTIKTQRAVVEKYNRMLRIRALIRKSKPASLSLDEMAKNLSEDDVTEYLDKIQEKLNKLLMEPRAFTVQSAQIYFETMDQDKKASVCHDSISALIDSLTFRELKTSAEGLFEQASVYKQSAQQGLYNSLKTQLMQRFELDSEICRLMLSETALAEFIPKAKKARNFLLYTEDNLVSHLIKESLGDEDEITVKKTERMIKSFKLDVNEVRSNPQSFIGTI